MNILFVNYGGFTSNSLNHIGPFSSRLAELGHDCIVAVPDSSVDFGMETLVRPRFTPTRYEDFLAGFVRFADGRGPDLIHAWTPRENVRRFVLACLRRHKARLIVHLEDNELFLSCVHLGIEPNEALAAEPLRKAELEPEALAHPVLHSFFLRMADAVTVIVPSLREKVPAGLPCLELPPGVDRSLFHPQPADPALRQSLQLSENEHVIVFTGSNTFANEAEMRELYEAVKLLNDRGLPTRLVRTGLFSRAFTPPLSEELFRHVTDLGFVEKQRLPGLLALSSVAVQPGRPGPFNDYRLPSKIPELLAMGLPLILPPCNVGLELVNGEQALVLNESSSEAIADACARLFRDRELAQRIGQAGLAFSLARYDLVENTGRLEAFYREILQTPPRKGSAMELGATESDLTLWLRSFIASLPEQRNEAQLRELLGYLDYLMANQPSMAVIAELRKQLAIHVEALGQARQHASQIRVAAETRDALTQQHVRSLDAIITHLQQDKAAGKAELEQVRSSFEQQVAALQTNLEEKIQDLEKRNQEKTQLREQLASRESKIARMQSSASWKLTMPLRWLRRCFEKAGDKVSEPRGSKVL